MTDTARFLEPFGPIVCMKLSLIFPLTMASASALTAADSFVNSAGLKMLPIQSGSFTMGESIDPPSSLRGPTHSPHGDWDEHPVHKVAITRAFFISETPVTQEAFRQYRAEATG